MFGTTAIQKTVNGAAFTLIILMFVGVGFMIFSNMNNTTHTYTLTKSELGIQFGYHIKDRIKAFELDNPTVLGALSKSGISADDFTEAAKADLVLEYDNHQLIGLNANLVHSKEFDKATLAPVYQAFNKSVDEFLAPFNKSN